MTELVSGEYLRDPANTVVMPPLCDRHNAEAVQRMGYGPQDHWRSALLVLQLLLFYRVMMEFSAGEEKLEKLDTPTVNTKLAERGCLACADDSTFRLACRLVKEKGLEWAANVAQGKKVDPEWTLQ